MSTLDLTVYPYERMVNTSYKRDYHEDFFCICKDELLESLSKIVTVENFDKYSCYITGKINTSSPYPTWDCDMIMTSSIEENLEEIFEIFKKIKNIGMETNLNYDLKYQKDMEIFTKAVESPDISFNISNGMERAFGYDMSKNEFVLCDTSRNVLIRKKRNKDWTYYKPLLMKAENSSTLEQGAIDFITNSNLPDSSERNNEFAVRKQYIYNVEKQRYEKHYL